MPVDLFQHGQEDTYAVFQTFIVGESLTAFMVYILAIIGIVMVMILTWNLQKPDTVTTTWTMDIGNMFFS
jgi:hypothetical protein